LNVQLAVVETDDPGADDVYVLEANPRSSRTVPFVSKATEVPIAKLAARVMAGESLSDLDVAEQVPQQFSVKEVVLPFDRLPNADPRLGPEMKSTGEVMGTASTFGKAYDKAQHAASMAAPDSGTVAVEVDDDTAEEELTDAFADYYEVVSADADSADAVTSLDAEDTAAAIRAGEIDFLVSTERDALREAVEEEIPYVSTVEAARATLDGLAHRSEDLDTVAVSDRPRKSVRWGGATGGD
ncbi:MAG: carbamoyl-phosphate synthase large subunit, partial [Halobaculum sp.]